MKYEILNNDSILYNGIQLYRIKALKDFSDVKKGDLGGYIEKPSNLSQNGICWVYDNSKVLGENSCFYHDSVIKHNSIAIDVIAKGSSSITNKSTVNNSALEINVNINNSNLLKSHLIGKFKVIDSNLNTSFIVNNLSEDTEIKGCTLTLINQEFIYLESLHLENVTINDDSEYFVFPSKSYPMMWLAPNTWISIDGVFTKDSFIKNSNKFKIKLYKSVNNIVKLVDYYKYLQKID